MPVSTSSRSGTRSVIARILSVAVGLPASNEPDERDGTSGVAVAVAPVAPRHQSLRPRRAGARDLVVGCRTTGGELETAGRERARGRVDDGIDLGWDAVEPVACRRR